ncbi:MAG TPA: glucoamylase family protein [Blastocatellia bacterium]|nr:glucoamylase family protein [Blastocatellia bacterium]
MRSAPTMLPIARFNRTNRASDLLAEEPIRGELLGVERLQHLARELAAAHRFSTAPEAGRDLLGRLDDNSRLLHESYLRLTEAGVEEAGSPAAEWLVDNFHIVEEQLREIREDLPRTYYRELPKLTHGVLAGYPRVYAIALEVVAHCDSRLDVELLKQFVSAYQEVTVLTIGELWAMAISLRLALVENLRRLALLIVSNRDEREGADEQANRLLEIASRQPEDIVGFLRSQIGKKELLGDTFLVELAQRLRDQQAAVAPVLDWIERRLSEQGKTIAEAAHLEHERQAENQITVANIITSMRGFPAVDWEEFFESVSLIEPILREDPAGTYAEMDFKTRDRYRHEIERINKRTSVGELDVARHAMSLARRAAETGGKEDFLRHVGYYIVDDGSVELERVCGYKPTLSERAERAVLRSPSVFYFAMLALLTVAFASVPVYFTLPGNAGLLLHLSVIAVSLIPASEMAISVVNWVVTQIFKPVRLPRMDTSSGVPERATTMIVIPTMLVDEAAVQLLVEKIEVLHIANEDDNIYFAILSDFPDAPSETTPADEGVLQAATEGVSTLNARYPVEAGPPRFHLLHRRRLWNPCEGAWIGWERKRGKLREFNQLLRGDQTTSFTLITAERSLLERVRYVITLDTDTQLPRDGARRLVGTILHPLNQPQFDARVGRITRGYAILQPRIGISLTSASRSRFALAFSGSTGVDPYTTAVSDVYQDLFGEGSYTGKGLYEVDAFETALGSRFPENTLLSHDLLEGLLARTALITDIELLDDHPAQYDAYTRIHHRWIRGDWQAARWLMLRARDAGGRRVRNRLPIISRWKILDNLRRSLMTPAVLVWLLLSWTVLPGSPLFWTVVAALMMLFPVYAQGTATLLQRQRGVRWAVHLEAVWDSVGLSARRSALSLTFLAHGSLMSLDAIFRTIWRMFVSHRRLLEWVTAAEVGKDAATSHAGFWRLMFGAPAFALVSALLVLLFEPSALFVASPFLALWLVSPSIAYLTGRSPWQRPGPLNKDDIKECRLLARRTWRYFETFVGEEDHWLPPDNFQEVPRSVVAHRTSPTNVGLLLLATTAAHDFGYTATLELIERLELTFAAFEKLPRYRGHFFNWYDTHSLEPLKPRYISTVDSGNLAGHLIAVKQACLDLGRQPVFGKRCLSGLADSAALLRREARQIGSLPERAPGLRTGQLVQQIEDVYQLLRGDSPRSLSEWNRLLESLVSKLEIIHDMINVLVDEHGGTNFGELQFWGAALLHQAHTWRRDLQTLTPWAGSATDKLISMARLIDPDALGTFEFLDGVFNSIPAPDRLGEQCEQVISELQALREDLTRHSIPTDELEQFVAESEAMEAAVKRARQAATDLLNRTNTLAQLVDRFVDEMDFAFLFDERRHVLTIGFNVTDGRRDESFYDLLASEARLGSFIAIATGDVPADHWFRLGRQLASVNGSRALVSWTASMFEYLMPLLVMRSYDGTLLDETYRTVVDRQIEYGRERGVPWGVSESAYNARDLGQNYQYGPFGIPGMGLKRGLSEDLVVAPYATLLAAMVRPNAAVENLRRLAQEGAVGRYGLYESIDYTPERVRENETRVVIRAFMTHHQGMNLVALDNLLHRRVIQRRFHSEAKVQATELLLQERLPRGVPTAHPRAEEVNISRESKAAGEALARRYHFTDLAFPRTHLLSNGTYSVMITASGSGYSMRDGLAVNRWREDPTRDNCGFFCYLRDSRSGAVWSSGFQPTLRSPESYEVSFSEHRAEIMREDVGLTTQTEIIVSSEDAAELRRVSITNRSTRTREIELTSYAEIVLATPQSDAAHRAFSNLFVETEVVGGRSLLARRRPRSSEEKPIWCWHTIAVTGESVGARQYETDRARFIGRGRTSADPLALMDDVALSNTIGAVLDPVFCLRQKVRVKRNETVRVCLAMGVSDSREEAVASADKYSDPAIFEREESLAWTRSRVELRHLGVEPEDAHVFQRLASRVIFPEGGMRPPPWIVAQNTKSQSGLWAYGISGDLPIVLVRLAHSRELDLAVQLFRAYQYWKMKGLAVDLVILNEYPASYLQSLQDDILALARKSGLQPWLEKRGGIHLLRADIMPAEDRVLLQTVARVSAIGSRGSLEAQLNRKSGERELPRALIPRWPRRSYVEKAAEQRTLAFFNGLGGFSQRDHEYVISLGEKQWTPAPWINVISNDAGFGFVVSETGSGFTWFLNSHENRLTPWSNDAVSDQPGEVIYIRDEDSGSLWTPTPLPIRHPSSYITRHGQGYTVFEHTSRGISQELIQFVPTDHNVKISLLKLTNNTDRSRRLSVTSYSEPVLGERREQTAPFIITEADKESGAIVARNYFSADFRGLLAFSAISGETRTYTCDRLEFLGPGGSPSRPAGLSRASFSDTVTNGFDPCIAMQTSLELAPQETVRVVVLLGQAKTLDEMRAVVSRFTNVANAEAALEDVKGYWDGVLSAIQVRTPDSALDVMMNRWLLYQALSCRLLARSGFYQSAGAYGFRDQLQDVMALVYSRPALARAHILRAGGRQFKEGDVQHWWHPPSGRGLRTRISDDAIWLPYVSCFYADVTGDLSIFDEEVPFIEAPAPGADENESYAQPVQSGETVTLFEHCARALERSLHVGSHGLPLIGTGDWNDGMNKVGVQGRGESVWLGWFLYASLDGLQRLCGQRGQKERSDLFAGHMRRLKQALAKSGWDGSWYRRAYFDDGTPLGSSENRECRIDSISQSWSVLSRAADPRRQALAMASVDEHLVVRRDAIVRLLTPPFDKGVLEPGYIKGYLPGVRENGGQYSHAAMWVVIAFAMLGDGDKAAELLALLNPIGHTATRAGMHRYRVEPYVVAGDVYSLPPHTGRGGWTWYTGAAAWMYRAALESVLGFTLRGRLLRIEPCIPKSWREFRITYRHGTAVYLIDVRNPDGICTGVAEVTLDGALLDGAEIPLSDDGREHRVGVLMGSARRPDVEPVSRAAGSLKRDPGAGESS